MPAETKTTFTCDRDGTVSAAATGTNPPMGWMRQMVDATQSAGGTVKSTMVFLCPECATLYEDYLGKSLNEVQG